MGDAAEPHPGLEQGDRVQVSGREPRPISTSRKPVMPLIVSSSPPVGSHLGLRISNFVPKKPSNVRISTNNILTFDGFASLLELRAEPLA